MTTCCWKTEVFVGIPDQVCITVNHRSSDSQLLCDSLQYLVLFRFLYFCLKISPFFLACKSVFHVFEQEGCSKIDFQALVNVRFMPFFFLIAVTIQLQLLLVEICDCSEISGAHNPFLIPMRALPAEAYCLSQKYLSQND